MITEAFLAIATAQQQALGYPELPFVMLEHPVAVATEAEVEHKVALVYTELLAKLTSQMTPGNGETA